MCSERVSPLPYKYRSQPMELCHWQCVFDIVQWKQIIQEPFLFFFKSSSLSTYTCLFKRRFSIPPLLYFYFCVIRGPRLHSVLRYCSDSTWWYTSLNVYTIGTKPSALCAVEKALDLTHTATHAIHVRISLSPFFFPSLLTDSHPAIQENGSSNTQQKPEL